MPRRVNRTVLVRSVTPAWPATAKARDFNWHTVAGFWCGPTLLVLAVTGVVLAFPWATRLLYSAAGTPMLSPQTTARVEQDASRRTRGSAASAGEAALPEYRRVDAAWGVAERQLPTWQTIALRIQARGNGPHSFTITDAAHWNRFARSQLTVADGSGTVLRWDPYGDLPRGQRWRGWARYAHTGELGGLIGQLVAGTASAGAALLAWTGISLAMRRSVRSIEVKRDAQRAA